VIAWAELARIVAADREAQQSRALAQQREKQQFELQQKSGEVSTRAANAASSRRLYTSSYSEGSDSAVLLRQGEADLAKGQNARRLRANATQSESRVKAKLRDEKQKQQMLGFLSDTSTEFTKLIRA